MVIKKKEVLNLKLCMVLKEIGYPQEGGELYWVHHYNPPKIDKYVLDFISAKYPIKYLNNSYKSPTIFEMWEWLPESILRPDDNNDLYSHDLILTKNKIGYIGEGDNVIFRYKINLANTIAKMLIWFKKAGYVDFKKDLI